MTAASRRGAIICVVAVTVLVVGLVWFVSQDDSTPQDMDVIAAGANGSGELPVFRGPDPAVSEPVAVPPDLREPELVVTQPLDEPDPEIDWGPIVARGSVSWPMGFGVESVEVILYDDEGYELDLAETDANGMFELRYDEPLRAGWGVGTEALGVNWGGATTFLLPAMCSELSVHVPGDPPEQCGLRLGFAPTLAGQVTSRVDGGPIEFAEVYAASTLRAWSQVETSTLTEEDGTYLLPLGDLPSQDVIVWFLADDHQASVVGPMDLTPADVPGEVARVDAALDSAGMLQGRVIDARSGVPLDGVMVTAGSSYSAFTRSGDWDVTADGGEFALDTSELPPFGSWVLAQADDYGPAVIFPDSPAGTHEIHLGPIQVVDGLVLDAVSGEPIEDADVMIAFVGDTWELDHGMYDEEFTDADGHFEIRMETAPIGGARVRVTSDGHVPMDVPLELVAKQASGDTWQLLVRLTSL